jgi:hypothetical protein
MFDVTTDDRIWSALLSSPGKCVLTYEVVQELQAWLRSHDAHPGAKALANGHEGFRILEEGADDAVYANSFAYYVNLLSIRKRLPKLYGAEEIQRRFGERAALIAKKAKGSTHSRTFYTDESLVYQAVSSAILTGRHTVVLSKDEDIQEQFYKLIFLLDTHYRGMLLADLYSRNFSAFAIHQMPMVGPFLEVFLGSNNVLIERYSGLEREVLPTECKPVIVECWTIGSKYFSAISFCAEMEMGDLLRLKGETGGRNTKRLGARNCHFWLAPLPIATRWRVCAAVAEDITWDLKNSSVHIPYLDIQQSIASEERVLRREIQTNPLWTPPLT